MSSARPAAAPHVVLLRVSGVEYRVTLTAEPNGGARWATKTRYGDASGSSPTPLMALQSARDYLQCAPWHHQEPEATDDDLEALLEHTATLVDGGVRRFARRAS